MKRTVCFLLCLFMLMGVLIACDSTEGNDPAETTAGAVQPPSSGGNTNSPVAGNTTTASPDPSVTTTENLPPQPEDFGDPLGNARVYTMLVRKGRYAYLYGTETSSASVQAAAYKRNEKLNSMYNIDIQIIEDASGHNEAGIASFNTMIGASDGEYDIAVPDHWWGIEYTGYFENLMTVQEIDVDDPWWVHGWNENMIINNRLYTVIGDAALELMENIEVVFYNKTIEAEYDYDLYGTFHAGKWTLDEMISTIEVFNDALNNTVDSDDVYGVMYDRHALRSQLFSSGVTLLKTNRNNGVISVIANSQRNVNVSDKIAELCHHTSTMFVPEETARTVDLKPFINSKLFLYAGCLYNGTALKAANTTFDYGILMMPKYEEGDDYRSTSYGVSVFGIPITCSDTHVAAVVLDAMNWLSNTEDEAGLGEERLTYTYYNTVLKGQVSNSPEDNVVLDMSRELAFYDFGFNVNNKTQMLYAFQDAIVADQSVSSAMDSIVSVAETGLTDIVAFYNR